MFVLVVLYPYESGVDVFGMCILYASNLYKIGIYFLLFIYKKWG